MEINELITLKLFDEALLRINELYEKKDYYDYYKYKTLFYSAQDCYEESVSFAKEMRKYCDSPFEILEFYLIFANHKRIFHFKKGFEKYLSKYSSDRDLLSYFEGRLDEEETKFLLNLDIQYLQLRIDYYTSRPEAPSRKEYITKLLEIAPPAINLQYQLFALNFESPSKIISALPKLKELFEQLDINKITIELYLMSADLLASHLMTQREHKEAEAVLVRAKTLAGNYMLDARKRIISKLAEAHYSSGNHDLSRKEGKYYLNTYVNIEDPIIINNYPATRRLVKDEHLVKGEKLFDESSGALNSIIIYPGELISLRGPKDSGKSTLLNYILGVDHPDEGEVYFQETNIGGLTVKEMLQFRKENMSFAIEEKVILRKIYAAQVDPYNYTKFINEYPDEIKYALIDLKDYMQIHKLDDLLKFFNELLEEISNSPKLVVMNEPFANVHGEVLDKLFQALKLLARHHNLSILIETHHSVSSDYTDCQYFIRDSKIVEVIERVRK